MSMPELTRENIIDALKYIDENGVPERNESKDYDLVSEDGKKYPPKYVVAVADHLANGADISTSSFNSVEARNYLAKLGFTIKTKKGYRNSFSDMLRASKNLILRGAPGTGKTYLAKEIAAYIVSNKQVSNYSGLSPEQQEEQIELVQFHPSYDYTDFVEGLRPKFNKDDDDKTMYFELKPGIFKDFVDTARKNYENFQKAIEEAISEFLGSIELNKPKYETSRGSKFSITKDNDDENIEINYIPKDEEKHDPGNHSIKWDDIRTMLKSGREFKHVYEVTALLKQKTHQDHSDSYIFPSIKKLIS